MKRRNFLTKVIASGTVLGISPQLFAKNDHSIYALKEFNLNYAPHLGMFKHHAGDNPIDQLNFMADQGFMAFEDNDMKNRDLNLQKKMADTMTKRGLSMGVFVAHKIYWKEPNLASGDENYRMEFLSQIKESVEVAKRVNAKHMTVVPGHLDLRQNIKYQTAHVIESLKMACDILEPHELTMVLEPLNFRDHPGLFLSESPQALKYARQSIHHLVKYCLIYTINRFKKEI